MINPATPFARATTGAIAGVPTQGILCGFTAAFTTAGELEISETVSGKVLAVASSDNGLGPGEFYPCGYAGGLTLTLKNGGVLDNCIVYVI